LSPAAKMCCYLGLQVWANPNPETTPLGRSVSPEQTITVLDPRHPLCGQTFTLVGMTYDSRFGRCCVVWFEPHGERLIPLQATHLAFDPNDIPASPLSLAAVEQLLRVVHDIQPHSQGVSSNASPPRPRGTPVPERESDCTPSTVATPLQRPTTARATGSDRCRETPGHTPTKSITP